MVKTAVRAGPRPREGADGIFRPERFKWRGATLRVALLDEPPFIARLDDVGSVKREAGGLVAQRATLTLLDTSGKLTIVRELPWPPEGEVRVVRAP